MKLFFPLWALLLCCAPAAFAQYTPFFPDEMIVTASALIMRETPDQNGKKMTSLPRGTVVEYLEAYNHGEFVQLDTAGAFAPWLKVRYKDKTGYVFGAFLSGTYALAYEDDILEDVPPLQWYGVYKRDSFSDEVRKIDLRITEEFNEMFGEKMKTLKTNQKDPSKFLVGSLNPMKQGYAGPLGVYHVGDFYTADGLFPGAILSIYPGQEVNDTTMKPTWQLAATGCARFTDDFIQVSDYRLILLDYEFQPAHRQDLTHWLQTEMPDISPNVSLVWYGDLDKDNKPDVIIQDCPYEAGCRASLYLSSKAKPGEYLHKVCEHFWPGE
jgi:hypothetical protein